MIRRWWLYAGIAVAATPGWAAAQTRPPGAAAPAATSVRMAPAGEAPALPPGTVDDVASVGELTVVTSDRLEYDAQKGSAVFERNVIVSDPNLKMKCDKLTIFFTGTSQVTRVLAEGRVVMSQDDKKAWAAKATYDLATGQIELEGDARVMRGRDMLLADTITYWRDQNRMVGRPNARLIIYPEPGGKNTILKGMSGGGRSSSPGANR